MVGVPSEKVTISTLPIHFNKVLIGSHDGDGRDEDSHALHTRHDDPSVTADHNRVVFQEFGRAQGAVPP